MSRFDVVAVSLKTHAVTILATDKSERTAEAIVSMVIRSRGVDEEFFAEVPHGRYTDGDEWCAEEDE